MPELNEAAPVDAPALVTAAHGRHFALTTDDGGTRVAVSRGRRSDIAVGDRVRWQDIGGGQAAIEEVLPRRSTLCRSDARRAQVLAANVDQAAFVVSGEPPFDEELLLRAMLAAESEGIGCAIVATKADLAEASARIEPRLRVYEALGYPVLRVSVRNAPDAAIAALAPLLRERTTLLLGQSGMGKSSLINLLVPHAEMRTNEISEALRAGRHTTTFSRAFELGPPTLERHARRAWLIDSPGFQLFGVVHLSDSQRQHGMREFGPLLGRCRFHNCTHAHEPGCAIRAAVDAGDIDALRYRLFLRITGS